MADFLDRAILMGMGLEKKLRELMEELEKKGKEEGKEAKEEGLPPKKRLENKLVEDGVKAIRELLCTLKDSKERLGKDISGGAEKVAERLNLATRDELDIVKEMARLSREKVDLLEKRIKELEEKGKR